MQLIHLATNPRNLLRKVDLIAEDLTSPRRRPQRIQRAVHDARRRLLVIEDAQHACSGREDEDRECVQPLPARLRVRELAVCTSF